MENNTTDAYSASRSAVLAFHLALKREAEGNHDSADKYLNEAIQHEAAANAVTGGDES